ncbi:MAG: (2Fe-2S)-binding protein [Proteobacteria bacterium]|nr:(2Fe-2S)-binding protein [Pseudomonadota bacterium]
MEKELLVLTVNEEVYEIAVKPNDTLLEVLREKLDLVGTKEGCGLGECGTCTVLINGRPMLSCLTLALDAAGSRITTIEGVAPGEDLDPLQQAFITHGAVQCGYCTPGMILTAKELLQREARPTAKQIKEAIAGNLCRCTGYIKIVEAIQAVKGGEGL